MDMKKMIQRMTDLENAGKKNLNESTAINECPPMESPMDAPMAAQNPGNPVTMSISLNASGKDHVADLINMMKNAGLEDAKPAADAIMPMRTDMERLRGIVDGPAGGLDDREMDLPGPDDIEGSEDESYAEVINDDDLEEYDNEPNPEYQDHKYMTKDLSGGLNREKNSYAAAQDGDNAMAVEDDDDTSYSIKGKTPDAKRELAKRANSSSMGTSMEETIKAQLYKALTEKKAKPDFLDVDKDGDKKEPMKKALKDKGSKPKKGQVPPQLKKKTNESAGNIDDTIRKIFGKIYDRGDTGLDYLDNNAPFYDQLATMHGGDLDEILANISDQEKMKLGRELKSALDSMSFDLESTTREDFTSEADASDPKAIIRQRTIELARKANVSMKNVNLDKVYKFIAQRKSLGRGPINQQPEKIEKLIEYYQNMASKANPNYNDRVMDLIYDKVVEMVDEVAPMIHNNSENAVSEISSDLAKRYTKNAKVDRDNTDHILKRDGSTNDWKANQELQKRNSKRTKGINRAAKRVEK